MRDALQGGGCRTLNNKCTRCMYASLQAPMLPDTELHWHVCTIIITIQFIRIMTVTITITIKITITITITVTITITITITP